MEEKDKLDLEMKYTLAGYPFLKDILHNLKQVVWIVNLGTGRVLYVSPAFETVWGCSCDSFYSDPLTLIRSVHPEDRIKVISYTPGDNRSSMGLSYRIFRPDGSLRWISAYSFQIYEESSSIPYQVWVAEDVTEQNQVDQTLRKALDRSREQFSLSRRMSLARKPDVVLKTLMSASELRAAKHALVMFFDSFRDSPSRVAEIIVSWSSYVLQTSSNPIKLLNDVNLVEELAILEILHPSKPVIITDVYKDQRLTPAVRDMLLEGKIQTVLIFPMVALGNWLGCLLVFFDTQKQIYPIELRHLKVLVDQATITLYNLQLLEFEAESRHEAERANEIKTEFLAMISHELRTPLTSIIGFATTLLAEDVTWEPEEQRDFVLTIFQEANRLEELINHLLDLSRLEAGMLPIIRNPHTLREILDDALPQLQVLTRDHILSIHLSSNLPEIYVDSIRIAQVLVNLVRNASTYAPKGTEIVISANIRGSFLQINVSDQGPGISPVDRKRVFKAFQRGINVDNGSVQGAGLGLAICKGLIEAHGGRIWIRKKNTPGATVSFTIPLVTAQTPELVTKEE